MKNNSSKDVYTITAYNYLGNEIFSITGELDDKYKTFSNYLSLFGSNLSIPVRIELYKNK